MTHAFLPETLWFTRCPVPTATGIAADLGWLDAEFAPEGIAVRSLQDVPPDVARDHHFTHALTGLFREGGNVPARWARSRGERTRLIGLTWIEERQTVLVAAGSDIHDARQLRGRRLAVPRHSIAIDFWRAMALRGFEGALAVEAARRQGARVAAELDEHPDPRTRVNNGTPRPVTVHQRLLDDHPDLVVRFLSVLIRAADWAAEHPREATEIAAADLGGTADDWETALRALPWRIEPVTEAFFAEQQEAADILHGVGFIPRAVTTADAVARKAA